MTDEIAWGPSGQTVYERTYSRTKPNGSRETWPETVKRVARGNLALVHGPDMETWPLEAVVELGELEDHMLDFRIIPAGRHLWATGVKGRQYLFNCHVAPWGDKLSRHYEFTFLRLMEGGGVGGNYSMKHIAKYGAPRRSLNVHIVCSPDHPDYEAMLNEGVLSGEYSHEWEGSFEVEDSREGWADALTDLIDTFMTDNEVKHNNRVYDVTNVRAAGARLKTFGGVASGPKPFAVMMHKVAEVLRLRVPHFNGEWDIDLNVPVFIDPLSAMEIDHAIAECVVSGGNRRSARMAIVHWDDPYIENFIHCKQDTGDHWTTNISVEIDQRFTYALDGKLDAETNRRAAEVHKAVVEAMFSNGEPGYWNSTYSNIGEPREVIATNPCGEIALMEAENCNLAHVNMDAFAPKRSGDAINEGALIRAHQLVTRFLIRATYGDVNDDQQAQLLAENRRIGVGHFGVQGFLVKNGWKYSEVASMTDSPGYNRYRQLLGTLYGVVRTEARKYAFALRIPEPVKVTTVAPTGSIAKLPGAQEGIHPIYARFFERRIRFSLIDPAQSKTVDEAFIQGYPVEVDQYDASGNTAVVVYPTKELLVEQVEALGLDPLMVESADEIALGSMLAFQAMYQEFWADNAVSFTVNVPEGIDLKVASDTIAFWLPKIKGTTIMPDASRPQAPYTRITQAEYESAVAKSVEDAIDLECATGACPVR